MNFRFLFIFSVLAVILLAACATPDSTDGNTVIVTDLAGREVTVPASVDRVVAIGPGALRFYVYAGNLEYVVGVEDMETGDVSFKPYMLANPHLSDLPIIGQGGPNNTPNPEKLLMVDPDVIFSTYTTDATAANELEAKTGIPVVILNYGGSGFGTTPIFDQTVQDSLLLIGQISKTNEKAQNAVNFILQSQDDLESRTKEIPDDEKPTIYVGCLGSKGTHGIESTQGKYPLLDVIHAQNVVDETGESGSIMIDREKLLDWDPDYIFIDQGGYAAVLEDYQKAPKFYESLSAVQNDQVYAQLPYNYYNTNLGTAIANAYYLGTILYPDEFADIDPEQKADEIYQILVGHSVYEQLTSTYGGFDRLALGEP